MINVDPGLDAWSYVYNDLDAKQALSLDSTIGEIRDNPVAWSIAMDKITRPLRGNMFFAFGLRNQDQKTLREALAPLQDMDGILTTISKELAGLDNSM